LVGGITLKETALTKVFYAVNYVVLGVIALLCLFPLLHEIAVSFSNESANASGIVGIWPVGFSTGAYHNLLMGTKIISAFVNSVIITVVGTALSMVATILTAYPISRKYFVGRKIFLMLILFTMLFGAGVIPTYLIANSLHLINSWWAIWLIGLISPFNLFIMKTFFEEIHEELIEAARIDGTTEFQLIIRLILPLSVPVMAALSLFYGVGYWNVFSQMLIYVQDIDKMNLAVFVQNMVQSQQMLAQMGSESPSLLQEVTPKSIEAAAIVIMIVPMLLVYPFLQKHFTSGIMLGSLKG
jgi:putative aldouronate transport system permease protein